MHAATTRHRAAVEEALRDALVPDVVPLIHNYAAKTFVLVSPRHPVDPAHPDWPLFWLDWDEPTSWQALTLPQASATMHRSFCTARAVGVRLVCVSANWRNSLVVGLRDARLWWATTGDIQNWSQTTKHKKQGLAQNLVQLGSDLCADASLSSLSEHYVFQEPEVQRAGQDALPRGGDGARAGRGALGLCARLGFCGASAARRAQAWVLLLVRDQALRGRRLRLRPGLGQRPLERRVVQAGAVPGLGATAGGAGRRRLRGGPARAAAGGGAARHRHEKVRGGDCAPNVPDGLLAGDGGPLPVRTRRQRARLGARPRPGGPPAALRHHAGLLGRDWSRPSSARPELWRRSPLLLSVAHPGFIVVE